MRNARKRRRLQTGGLRGELEVAERIVHSARKRKLTSQEVARVTGAILTGYERVCEIAAEEGVVPSPLSSNSCPDQAGERRNLPGGSGREPLREFRNALESVEGRLIVPGQPIPWTLGDIVFPFQQYRQIAERVDVVQAAGMDQRHVQVTDHGTVVGEVEE